MNNCIMPYTKTRRRQPKKGEKRKVKIPFNPEIHKKWDKRKHLDRREIQFGVTIPAKEKGKPRQFTVNERELNRMRQPWPEQLGLGKGSYPFKFIDRRKKRQKYKKHRRRTFREGGQRRSGKK